MRIGILTGGGDAPGLNAAIRAIVRKGAVHGAEMLGFRNGWRGVLDGDVRELTKGSVQGILHRGGTILGSSGADPYHEGGIAKVRRTFADLALDGLIAVGGEGTLGAASHMTEEGLPVVGGGPDPRHEVRGRPRSISRSAAPGESWSRCGERRSSRSPSPRPRRSALFPRS
jgi:6-phosphofructokinase 1